ncbi:MAG TPA: DUF433 domain-containing protein [Beijerinckiaceae bacterium]|nr:DUF433 domain-containing protein [Beijerinckiaceae bacterium]
MTFYARKSLEMEDSALARISIDPEICGGRPCIRGTRMRISDLIEMLASGATKTDILADYDNLTEDDIAAALAYAARATNDRVITDRMNYERYEP